jgi:hypothetical protein
VRFENEDVMGGLEPSLMFGNGAWLAIRLDNRLEWR